MRYILILLFAFCFTYANVNKDNNDTKELSSLIDSIKSAKGDARRVKMNQLKLFLRSMNEKKRIKVIAKVKKILQEEAESRNTNRPSKVRESYINHNKLPQNDISKTQVPVHTNPVQATPTQPTPTHPNPISQTHQPSRTPIPQSNPPSCPIPKPTNIIKHPPVAPPVSPPIMPKPNINTHVQENVQQNIQHVQEHIQQNINNVQHEIKNQIQHNIPTKFFPKLK